MHAKNVLGAKRYFFDLPPLYHMSTILIVFISSEIYHLTSNKISLSDLGTYKILASMFSSNSLRKSQTKCSYDVAAFLPAL